MDRENNLGTLIYENYNRIYLTLDEQTIIKVFRNKDCYETEKAIYLRLQETGVCPKLLNYNDRKKVLEIEFIIEDGSIAHQPYDFYFSILDKLDKIYSRFKSDSNNFHMGRDLLKEAKKINKLPARLLDAIKKIESVHPPFEESFVHGDFRFANIRKYNSESKLIDFEASCIGDRNIDYAYLYWNIYSCKRDTKQFLEKLYSRKDFIQNNFKYYACFFLAKVINNRRFKEKQKALELLFETANS